MSDNETPQPPNKEPRRNIYGDPVSEPASPSRPAPQRASQSRYRNADDYTVHQPLDTVQEALGTHQAAEDTEKHRTRDEYRNSENKFFFVLRMIGRGIARIVGWIVDFLPY